MIRYRHTGTKGKERRMELPVACARTFARPGLVAEDLMRVTG
ncbi:MAG: hypothetical protein ACE5HK_06390 [Candidatus Methylomirabilales bacterium]